MKKAALGVHASFCCAVHVCARRRLAHSTHEALPRRPSACFPSRAEHRRACLGSTLCEASQSFWRLKFARGGRAPGSVSHRRAVRGEGDTGHPAARDRFPFENAGHLGHVPARESWRVAGERPEHCDLHRGRACPPRSAAGPRSWCRSNHLGPQILRDGMVLDCFPVERKRRLLKAYVRTCARARGSSAASLPAAFSHPRTSR